MVVWKEFEDNEVTHSMAHYLMAIQELHKSQGYARVTDVARDLEITPGSASVSIKTLKTKGFVTEDRNRFLFLTEAGEKIAHDIHVSKKSFLVFLQNVLGVSANQADIDSCKVEHLLSTETREKLLSFLQYTLSDKKEAKSFREGLQKHDFVCPGTDNCGLCDDETCAVECDLHSHQPRK
ncbi:MAG: metal-dependent transcriptional regulator [Candidatus Sumerlaeia bacterium]|nr:metal-dependent transcriptional regulator [Candidatus Sumerlaeia bacterium]